MKELSKRMVASVLAFVLTLTMVGADLVSVGATEPSTEDYVAETVDGSQVTTEENNMPKASISDSDNGVKVTVDANEGILPEGVTMKVVSVADEDIINAVSKKSGIDADYIEAFDITLFDQDGNEVEPADSNKVNVTFTGIDADEAESVKVYHVSDDASKVELMTRAEGGDSVDFETTHFSTYVIVKEVVGINLKNLKGSDTSYSNPYTISYSDTVQLGVDCSSWHIHSYSWKFYEAASDGSKGTEVTDKVEYANSATIFKESEIKIEKVDKALIGKVLIAEGFCMGDTKGSLYFKVNKNSTSYSVSSKTATYTGEAFSATVTASSGETVESYYTDKDGNRLDSNPVNAGTYYLHVSSKENDTYYEGSTSFVITINKAEPKLSNVSCPTGVVLGKKLGDFSVTADVSGVCGDTPEGTVDWSSPSTTVEKSWFENIKSNWAVITKEFDVKFTSKDSNYSDATATVEATIYKAAISFSVTTDNKSYDGNVYDKLEIGDIKFGDDYTAEVGSDDWKTFVGEFEINYNTDDKAAPSQVGSYKVTVTCNAMQTDDNRNFWKKLSNSAKNIFGFGDNITTGFAGKKVVSEFSIENGKIDVTENNVETSYDGENHAATVTVNSPASGASITYIYGDKETTEAPMFKAAGSYQVDYRVEAASYDTLKGSLTVKIDKVDMDKADKEDISYSVSNIYYVDNKAVKPATEVSYNGQKLVEGTDYEVSTVDGTNVGTNDLTITFKGNYSGTIETTVEVNALYADFYQIAYDEETETWVTSKTSSGKGVLSETLYNRVNSEDWDADAYINIAKKDTNVRPYIVTTPVEGDAVIYQTLNYQRTKGKFRVYYYSETMPVSFYFLKEGYEPRMDLRSDSKSKFELAGNGSMYIDGATETLEEEAIKASVKDYPSESTIKAAILAAGYNEAEYEDFGLTLHWYRLIEENDGWHVDGSVYKTKDGNGNDIDPVPYERQKVTVTWTDEDKTTVLATETYYYGDTPSYKGETPVKASDFDNIYSFAGFAYSSGDKEAMLVSDADAENKTVLRGDTTFYASYKSVAKDKSVVNFLNEDGSLYNSVTVSYENGQRTEIKVPANPTKASDGYNDYSFKGWYEDTEETKGQIIDDVANMTVEPGSVVNLKAAFQDTEILYTVNFYNEQGSILLGTVDTYTYMEALEEKAIVSPVKASTAVKDYVFDGWVDENGNAVTSVDKDMNVYATYNESYISYVVTFKNYDGTVLATNTYVYGDALNSQGIPFATRLDDSNYKYTFAGWADKNGGIVAVNSLKVTESAVLTATYTATAITVEEAETIETSKSDEKVSDSENSSEDDSSSSSSKKKTKKKSEDSDTTTTGTSTGNSSTNISDNDVPLSDSAEEGDTVAEDTGDTAVEEAVTEEAATEESLVTEAEEKNIADDDVARAAKEDTCIIHWIILLLTLIVAAYTIIRTVVLSKSSETEDKKQEA